MSGEAGPAALAAPLLGRGKPGRNTLSGYTSEYNRVLQIAGPVALQSALGFSANLVSLAFVGHLGNLALSQAVLALSCYNVTGLSILLGLSMGMETACTQAYGAGNFRMVGVVLQRALLICSLAMLCVLLLWTQLDRLLLLAGQEPDIVAGAVHFVILNAPALYAYSIGECIKRFLMAQELVYLPMFAMLAAAVLCPVYNWLFVNYLGWGLTGAAFANDAVQGTSLLALIGVLVWTEWSPKSSQKPGCWGGWSIEALQGWGEYLMLALPNTAACFLEWGLYEGLILVAGLLPDAQSAVSVMGITFNTTTVTFCVSLGFAGAASTRIGTEVGAGNSAKAVQAFRTTMVGALSSMLVMAVLGCVFREAWTHIFTHDPHLVALATGILPVVFLSELAGVLNAACAGVMRGVGKQHLASIINGVCYWVVGLPLCVYVGLKTQGGLDGLWYALASTITLTGVSMLVACCLLDFEAETQRLSKQHRPPTDEVYMNAAVEDALREAAHLRRSSATHLRRSSAPGLGRPSLSQLRAIRGSQDRSRDGRDAQTSDHVASSC